jgi:hypothetical protein
MALTDMAPGYAQRLAFERAECFPESHWINPKWTRCDPRLRTPTFAVDVTEEANESILISESNAADLCTDGRLDAVVFHSLQVERWANNLVVGLLHL